MYINEAPYLQQLVPDFVSIMKENGWENFLSYRVKNGDKYAAVRLFRSYGSDRQLRHLGLTWSYDIRDTQFKDMRMISEGSPLGFIGVSKSGESEYEIPAYPVDVERFALFEDGVRVNPNKFTINNEKGTVTYNARVGTVLTANYGLSEKADDPPTHLTFFVFDNIFMKNGAGRVNVRIDDLDGLKYYLEDIPIDTESITVRLAERIRIGSSSSYVTEYTDYEKDIDYTVNSISGLLELTKTIPETENDQWLAISYDKLILVKSTVDFDGDSEVYLPIDKVPEDEFVVILDGQPSSDYIMDFETGQLTFTKSYTKAKVTFLDNTGNAPIGESQIIGDINVTNGITLNNTKSLMTAVYSSLHYVSPSLPTVVSFSTEPALTLAWQRDSQITMQGQLNRDRAMFLFRADPTGDASITLFSPLYFGRLQAIGKEPRNNMILAGGSNVSHELKYSKGLELGGSNVDYGPGTGNGNSGLILGQAVGGARYQTHYLRFFTFSKDADPNGEGRFNNSKWTGKYHVSLIGIVHPNDGVVGYLDDALAVHPKGIFQGNELETGIEERLEKIGIGDGRRSVFHLTYHPTGNVEVMIGCDTITDFTFDAETKAVTLSNPVSIGEDVRVRYTYSSLFHYFLPTAPRCAWRLKEYSPYVPMGIAFLKDSNHTPQAQS